MAPMRGGTELSGADRRWPTMSTAKGPGAGFAMLQSWAKEAGARLGGVESLIKDGGARLGVVHAFGAVVALALTCLLVTRTTLIAAGPAPGASSASAGSRYVPEQFALPAGVHGERALQRKFVKQGNTGFVSYSSYHLGYRLVTINGLTAASAIDMAQPSGQGGIACEWIVPGPDSANSVLQGTFHAVVDSVQDLPYSPTIIYCEFTTNEEAQALLRSPEGVVRVTMGNESFMAKPENKGFVDDNVKEEELPHFLAFCSAEIYGPVEPRAIVEWVAFHQHHIGFDHLYFYNGDAFTPELFKAVEPYMDAGILTVDDFVDTHVYRSNANGQRVAIHDCLHRARDSAAWVLYGDMDEYLVAERLPPPAVTFRDFLQEQGRGKAEVSRGSVYFELSCPGATEQPGSEAGPRMPLWGTGRKEFATEVLLYRQSRPHCVSDQGDNSMCDGWMGHRKGIVNPRMVYLEGGHEVQMPHAYPWMSDKWNVPRHVFSANDVYNAHYRGMTVRHADCGKVISEDDLKSGKIVKSDFVAKIAATARECAADKFRDEAKCLPWKAQAQRSSA